MSFLLIGFNQARLRRTKLDQRDFPGEVGRILDARIHPLTPGRAVDMGCIASQHNASVNIVFYLPFVDTKFTFPIALGKGPVHSGSLVEDGL